MSKRRDRDRTIDSDPATQGALGVPKILEPTGDPGGLHEEPDIERMLDREARSDDDATVHAHDRPPHERIADAQVPEELAAERLALAIQGGGSFRDEDDDLTLEDYVDRDAMEAGIVPQLVGQATLDSSAAAPEEEREGEPPRPRARAGRTSVHGRAPR